MTNARIFYSLQHISLHFYTNNNTVLKAQYVEGKQYNVLFYLFSVDPIYMLADTSIRKSKVA
jgi:hypothetical protein